MKTISLILLAMIAVLGANALADGTAPNTLVRTTAGDVALAVQDLEHGICLMSLHDQHAGKELLATKQPPLFEIELQKSAKDTAHLTSDTGWKKVSTTNSGHLEVVFSEPDDARFKGISAIVTATPLPGADGFSWRITVDDQNPEWALWEVHFPQVALARLGEKTTVLFPRGPGAISSDLWNKPFSYDGRYPSGSCTMQFAAVYDEGATAEAGTGLYFARHDDRGSTKDMAIDSDPAAASVRLTFSEPVAGMGTTPNKYELHGEAVWQVLRGDWFDAAMVYKNWVREHAQWWPSGPVSPKPGPKPQLGKDGREDTPLWMRELCGWAQTGGGPAECVQRVKDMQAFLGVPIGFHWYSWHQIPFDNDYPHYFPPKDGFADAVKDLQENNVYVMPYINGRLWDTRDKGAEDFEFTKIALPAATKDPDAKPHTETYESKESDGGKVTLAVMCPTTPLWQKTVKDIVLRLQNECGTKGVYIDQIAAAAPVLCMDKTHGHPLGGGYWWNEGYWQLLDLLRKDMQPDRMITTECNAEPFARWFDGYLTWHWQYDGQVAAFPAIYGGALQMFGRAYAGGATKDLALRMRAAQQLVFGEQIGWLDPKMLLESESKEFFKQAVRTRYQFRRYFYAGEMARPPRLSGDIPKVKADWQWGGEMWVTTDAVLTGAWRLPDDKKLVLIFANVSDAPVTADYEFNGKAYGLDSEQLNVQAYEGDTAGEKGLEKNSFRRSITVAPRKIVAWEVK